MKFLKLNRCGYMLICICAALEFCYIGVTWGFYHYNVDTWSYFGAFDVLLSGEIDASRPPLYPVFIGICKAIAGSLINGAILIVTIQCIVYMLSAFYLGKICKEFISSDTLCFFIVLFYVLCPGLNTYNFYVSTESFAMSLSVMLIWCIIKAFSLKTAGWQVAVWGISLALIMLRPIFIFLVGIVPLCAVLIWYVKRTDKRFLYANCILAVITIGAVVGYVYRMDKVYGVRSITMATTCNNYFLVRQSLSTPGSDKLNNSELIAFVDSAYRVSPELTIDDTYKEYDELINRFGREDVTDFVNGAISSNFKSIIPKIVGRFYNASHVSIFATTPPTLVSYIWDFFVLSISFFYIVSIVWAIVLCRQFKASKNLNIVFLFMWLFYTCNLLIAIAGAQAEWGRLTLPCAVPMLIFIGWMFGHLKIEKTDDMDA